MLMCRLHRLHGLHAPGTVGSVLAAVEIACSLPPGLQETNQEVPEFLSQAAAMAGPYVPPVRIGGGGSTFGGSFGKSFGSRGACLSSLWLWCQYPPARKCQHYCLACHAIPANAAANACSRESCSALGLKTQSTRCDIPRSQTSKLIVSCLLWCAEAGSRVKRCPH